MLNIGDTETEICVFTKRSSEKLLARLKQHHDYSVPFVPRACAKVDEEQVVILEKSWVERQKEIPLPKPVWFNIIGELNFKPRNPAIEDIQHACGKYFGTSRNAIMGQDRHQAVVYPRQVAMYLAKMLTPRSCPEIGRRFGGRDHTTVLHGFRKMERLIRQDWMIAFDVAHVEAML